MRGLAAALAALAILTGAAPARAQPPMWTVRDRDSTLVIFGSMHLLPPGLDWRPQRLTDALARADDVWFEAWIDAAAERQLQLAEQKWGLLPPGDTLWAHLTPEQADRLRRVADQVGVWPGAMDRWRPWYAELKISVIADAKSGGSATDGVERQLTDLTPPTARRRAFETAVQQIEFLGGAPLAEQVASLDETLKEFEAEPDQYARVVRDWMEGDVASIERTALTPLKAAAPVVYNRLITTRNRRWANILARRMRGSGETVVVVGVGHLVGPEGLPALLRARGFKVEGP